MLRLIIGYIKLNSFPIWIHHADSEHGIPPKELELNSCEIEGVI